MHVQMLGQRAARGLSEVEPDVEAVRIRYRLHHANHLLGERHQLAALVCGEVLELGHPPVRHHHRMARVVRVQVQHDVDQFAACDDQTVLVVQRRNVGERLRRCRGPALHRSLGQVVHPVGRPQALQMIRLAHPVVDDLALIVSRHFDVATLTNSAVGAAFSRSRIHFAIASTASLRGTPLIWVRSPNRKLTAPASTSRSPASSMNGTFWLVWFTIFLAIRSSLVSTSTRIPCDVSSSATLCRYSMCPSATGIPTT